MRALLIPTLLVPSLALAAQPAPKPNILLIVADDMGFSDPGCFGGEISTPNIDSLGYGGIRYTNFYNTARSWPSRASIMTGYYYQSVRGSSAADRPEGWSRAMPHYLSTAGYKCYLSGKWHVHEIPNPCADAGFDHSYNTTDLLSHYVPQDRIDDRPVEISDKDYFQERVATDRAIDLLRRHEADSPDSPFFLYLTYTAPHFPLHASQQDIDFYKGLYDGGWDQLRENRRKRLKELGLADYPLADMEPHARWHYQSDSSLLAKYGPGEVMQAGPWDDLTPEQKAFQSMKMEIHAAMVHRMDREIGRVLAELRQSGRLDNTLIIFLSDNGASAEMMIRGEGHDPDARPGSRYTHLCLGPGFATAVNTPLRRSKIWVHEGGISTPMIVNWKGHTGQGGGIRHATGHLIDLLPTFLEVAGVDPYAVAGQDYPKLHGLSLLPSFAKDAALKRDHLWFNHEGNYALHQGRWKITASELDGKYDWALYDLQKDRGESRDLSAEQPVRVGKMAARWQELTDGYKAQNPNPSKTQLIDGFPKKNPLQRD